MRNNIFIATFVTSVTATKSGEDPRMTELSRVRVGAHLQESLGGACFANFDRDMKRTPLSLFTTPATTRKTEGCIAIALVGLKIGEVQGVR